MRGFVNIPENFHVFGNFFWKKFGGFKNLPYLCTRFRSKTIAN